MNIIVVTFPAFEHEIRIGKLSKADKQAIQSMKKTMSYDEYAGYSPNEQEKYTAIITILNQYLKPTIEEV